MAESLKAKVGDALHEALGADAHIELEEMPDGEVRGLALSATFAGESPSARQDRIWARLDARLNAFERTRVVFILTDTPEEYEALKMAAV